MYRVKFEQISNGRVASERIACLLTADGVEEEVIIAPEYIEGDCVLLPPVAEEQGRMLFELPQESASGRWRLWISTEKVNPNHSRDQNRACQC